MLARLLPGADHLQNPHPLAVHFPIAFLYGAALLYFVAWLSRRDSIAWAALWFLVLGLATAAIALGTGWWSAPGVMLDPSVKENVLEPHKRLMLATLAIAAITDADVGVHQAADAGLGDALLLPLRSCW